MVIRLVDGTIYNPNEAKQQTTPAKTEKTEEVSNFPEIDLTDYHGYLLDEGNCVYVAPNTDAVWDGYGVERIKEHLNRIGYWKVVDKPEQAHFILQYGVLLTGRDAGCFHLRTRESYKTMPTIAYSKWTRVRIPGSAFFAYIEWAGEERGAVYRGVDWVFSTKTWQRYLKFLKSDSKKYEKLTHWREIFTIP